MPLQRPHYWSEDTPITTNQTYGWLLHENVQPTGYSQQGKYMVLNKPMPDLTYRKVVVKRRKKQSEDRLILPPAVGARGDARKALNDSTYWSSSPPYFDGANQRRGLDMFGSSHRPRGPSSDYFSDQARTLLYESLDYGYGKLIAEQKARRAQSASQLAAAKEKEMEEAKKPRPQTSVPCIPADDRGSEPKSLHLWHTNSGYTVRVVP